MGIAVFPKQSLPRVGKVASKASRIGFWRYEKERGRLSQVRDYTRAPERRPKRKPTPPRCAPCPFQGKGLGWTLPPSYGRRCPEGAKVGWGWRYEKERERSSQVCRLRKHPIHRWRGPPSPMGKATIRGYRFSRYNAFPNGEGKEEAASPQKMKPTPPRCARQPLPREGARVDTLSFLWKEVPRRGGVWRGKAV